MKRSTVILLALTALVGGSAPAATINVPGDQPTIAAAIGIANDGDEILIGSGTWNESIVLDADAAGFPLNLTLQGAGCWNTIWDAGGAGPCLQVTGTTAVSWDLADLAFTGGASPGAVDIVPAGGAWTVVDCRFFASPIMIQHRSDLTVTGSFFVDSPTSQHTGIVANSGTLSVSGSTFDNIYSGARVVTPAQAAFDHCIFSNLNNAGLSVGSSVGWDCICEWEIAATGSWPVGTNIIAEDPQFCGGVGTRNWGLQADSPCLDTGICGALIGARGQDCGLVDAEGVGWGDLKTRFR